MSEKLAQNKPERKRKALTADLTNEERVLCAANDDLKEGLSYLDAGGIQSARESFTKAIILCRAVSDPSFLRSAKYLEAWIKLCLAGLERNERNSEQAKMAISEASNIFRELGDYYLSNGIGCFLLAAIAQESGNDSQTVLLAEEAIGYARESKVGDFEADVLLLQARSLIKLDPAGALAAFWQVRRLYKKNHRKPEVLKELDAWIKDVIATQPQDEQQHIRATLLSYAEETRREAVARVKAEAILQEGRELIQSGAWQRGLETLRSARQLFSDVDDLYGNARVAIEIGDVQMRFGDYELARMSYLDAQRYLRKLGDENGIAVTQLKLGTLALYMYQAEEAQKQLQTASTFFRAHGDSQRAEISERLLTLAPEVQQPVL
ncbi:MAG: hypothetical protein U0Y68_23305 [Blastocatellia bacterium]